MKSKCEKQRFNIKLIFILEFDILPGPTSVHIVIQLMDDEDEHW